MPHWPWNFGGPNWPTMLPGGPLDNPQVVSPTQNFLGVTIAETPDSIPPDTSGAVGPSQFMVAVNGRIKAFDKATGALAFSVDSDSFFDPVRAGTPTTELNVRYDPLSQRWFLTAITVAPHSNRLLIARSGGPVLSAAGDFTFFFFQQDAVAPAGNTGQFLDDPSLGIDANALYVGGNMFSSSTGTFINTSAWVVNKASVLGAGPIVATAFRNLLIANVGPYSPRGVDNPDPAAADGYFIGVDNAAFGLLQIRRISDPGGSPGISPNIPIVVPTTTLPIAVPSMGGSPAAGAVDDRLFAAQVRRDRLTGLPSLVTAHNIQVTGGGVAGPGGRNGSRWYQIGSLGLTPTLVQSGTLFDPASNAPRSFWIPSIAMTGQGHMAIGCGSASSSTLIGCATAGRLWSDPPGSIQAPVWIAAGAGTYINNGGHFGEYSATCVDPVDDQSIWTFQEYMAGNGVWGVRAARLMAPPPATPIAAVPPAVSRGQSGVPLVITGASGAGSGFYDTEPGKSRLQGAFSAAGIVVTGVAWTDATHITLTIDISPTAPLGGSALTITNPDGQQSASAGPLITVIPAAVCPQFSANPDPVSLCDGERARFGVAVTGTPAPTLRWRRNQTPLIDGTNISGSTTPVLTVDPAGPADAGSYDCVATNDCGSVASDAATLTVDSPPLIAAQPENAAAYPGQPASFTVTAEDATGYQWRRDGNPLQDGGNLSGASTPVLLISPVSAADAGAYDCVASDPCGATQSLRATLAILCYPNCDGSTISPVLNVLDFACFLNAFAAGETYANCDGSTIPPALNVLDFACFLNAFAAGCP